MIRSTHLLAIAVTLTGCVFFANGCEIGGNEGDKCNPLVLQDECDSHLRCTQVTCGAFYCCSPDGTSESSLCKGDFCPTSADGGPDPDATMDAASTD